MLYQFINNNKIIGTEIIPKWIFLQKNGFYGLCNFEKCEGVVIDGIPYHLEGKKEIEGHETVSFEMISEEAYKEQLVNKQFEMLDIISEGVIAE